MIDVFLKWEEEMIVVDKLKSGKVMGFFNKIFYFDFIDVLDGDDDGVFVVELGNLISSKIEDDKVDIFNVVFDVLIVVEKFKSGKVMGFFNKMFYEFVDILDDDNDGIGVLELVISVNYLVECELKEEFYVFEEDIYFWEKMFWNIEEL